MGVSINPSAQEHFDTIINALMPFALEMIGQMGTFLPFGGFINKDGVFEQLTIEHHGSVEPKQLVTMFRNLLEQGVKNENYKAFGICAHMHAEVPGQSGKKDVIVTSMEDECGTAVDSYLTYERDESGDIVHGDLASELVEPTIFTTSKDDFVQ